MDDPSFFEVDLDEEKARRSILVTNVPENVFPKDVVIHFQKKSNGGGEVVDLDEHDNEHRSSVVITFEHPSIVEQAIARSHIIKEKKVNVQRYPVETKIPEIFSHVDARINLNLFGGSVALLRKVFLPIQREFGIQLNDSPYGYVISGSYEQISSCRRHILREIRNVKATQGLTGYGVNDMAAKAAPSDGATSRTTKTTDDEKLDTVFFQSVPIILEFIFSVPKYSKRIQDIATEFHVGIKGNENGMKVKLIPLPGCTRKQLDDACEEYIKLYREIYDSPMMSKDIDLNPANGSFYSAEDAVMRVLEMKSIVIQKMDEQNKWLFYGEERNVRSAITEISKMLMIDNPLKMTRKTKVRSVSLEEGESVASPAHVNTSGENERGEDVLLDNHNNVRNPVHKDFPGNTGQRLVIETRRGFRLTTYQGDITLEQVDVIVNFTDKHLSFSDGLSAAIVKRGGLVIKEDAEKEKRKRKLKPGDIVVTGPGRLSCSKMIHILTNKYVSRKEGEETKRLVREACFRCLKYTGTDKLKSIAFPAVGSGQQEMPLNVCASTMINAVEEYMTHVNQNKGAVTDIRFVHLDPAAVEAFKVELTRRYKDSIVTSPGEADNTTRSKYSASSLPADKNTSSSTDKKTGKKDEEDVCPICLDGFHDPLALPRCKHKFCRQCIDLAFQHRKVCPTCGMAYGVQTGNMPHGRMNHFFDSYIHLPGYERYGTIRIDYYFPDGTQGPEHPNPGRRYGGTSRTAYLPDCREGREVLDLLKKAFNARLTFTIGRSVTTGATNVVTWNDIHHKTTIHGGATGFGYPDPTYLKRVKEELAAKGIS